MGPSNFNFYSFLSLVSVFLRNMQLRSPVKLSVLSWLSRFLLLLMLLLTFSRSLSPSCFCGLLCCSPVTSARDSASPARCLASWSQSSLSCLIISIYCSLSSLTHCIDMTTRWPASPARFRASSARCTPSPYSCKLCTGTASYFARWPASPALCAASIVSLASPAHYPMIQPLLLNVK
jgi:hypothetical protein